MKKNQVIYMMCATALLSSCHIYKAYDRPDTIETAGIYRDPVSVTDTLIADTTNMGNISWKEIFRDPKLQSLIEEGYASCNSPCGRVESAVDRRPFVFPAIFESGSSRKYYKDGKYRLQASIYLTGCSKLGSRSVR